MKKTAVVPVLILMALAAPTFAAQHEHQQEMKMESSDHDEAVMSCEQMVEHRRIMQEHMMLMDQKLDGLVATMNAATGDAKLQAMADVINAMVEQRTQMRNAMETMQPMMMQHMMGHMQPGTAHGMKSMKECPMMNMHSDEMPDTGH